MAEERDADIRYILRPSEDVKFALDAFIITRGQVDSLPTTTYKNKAVLAVVTHRTRIAAEEEGSVLILKYKSTPTFDSRLEIYRVYPILGQFSISMAQTQRPPGHADLSPDSNSPLIQSPSEFTLSIQPGQDGVEPLVLLTQKVQGLRLLLAECKRLKEIAGNNHRITIKESRDTTAPENYTWLMPYIANHTPGSILSSTPIDLRISTKPVHARLSQASIDMPGGNLADINTIRDDWIRVKARQESKTRSKVQVRIRVGTFNVNGKMPSQDLASWVGGRPIQSGLETSMDEKGKFIPPLRRLSSLSLGEIGVDDSAANEPSNSEKQIIDAQKPSTASPMSSTLTLSSMDDIPDILVLGFQEVDLSTEALLYSTGSTREDAWYKAALAGLGEKAVLYEKIASKQLVGMLILVIAKKSIKSCFSDIQATSVGAGIMGLMGNKGATAIRLKLTPPTTSQTPNPCSTILTFVNSHLAAFDEMVDKRNSDFHDLEKRLNFDSGIAAYDIASTNETASLGLSIYESDLLVWMVNLNYRINLRDADVRSLIASNVGTNNIETLLRYDQLRIAMRNKRAFDDFSEGQIKHLPSYRFSAGIFTDDLGFDRKRKPAWTDRILHLSLPTLNLQQVSYTSHPEITTSDHRPVSAEYCFQLEIIDTKKYDAAIHKLYHTVSDFETGQEAPKIKLESNTIDFGKILYKQPVYRSLTLENRGKIPCIYYFVPQGSQGTVLPGWLQIEPMAGLLLPEETATFNLKAYVDNDSASKLNLTSRNIECTLILHTSLGRDYFIMVAGEYQYTCFANSLTLLTRLPGPIRTVANMESLLPERLAINAPREVMRLVNWMMENAVSVDGLFVSSADESLVATIRECLDTGADFPKTSTTMALAFAQTLLQLLNSWPEPVIPVNLHTRCAQITSRDEAFEFLDELPSAAANVWISVTAFLHFIARQPSGPNSNNAKNLAGIFAPVFLCDDDTLLTSYPPISPVEKSDFLLYFISDP